MELLLNNDENTIQNKLIELIEENDSIDILSPYVTKNKALDCILEKTNFHLKLVLDFSPESLVKGRSSIDVNQIKKLLDAGHEVFYNSELHSKLYITEESVIIGSSNFTHNGLSKRKESAILFEQNFNPKIYLECQEYFNSVLKSSTKITEALLNKTMKILDEKEIFRNSKLERLSELLSKDYNKRSLFDDYDLNFEYPKSLNELQKGLKFDFINYEEVESTFSTMFPNREKRKAERIAFIKDNLYEKNRGYNIKAKFENTSTVWKFYRDNKNEFERPLKSYKDFIIERSLELLKLYRKSFDIQPATGFFAKKFEYLKERGKIDDSFFKVKLSDFEAQWNFNLLKENMDEIDEFFENTGKLPNSYARTTIKKMKKKGTLRPEKERKLRYEGYLSDKFYQIKKKYKNNLYVEENVKLLVEEYFKKWKYDLNYKRKSE